MIMYYVYFYFNLVLPQNQEDICFDLKLSLDDFVPHIPHQKGIDAILQWIIENKNSLLNDTAVLSNSSKK
jgi:hypothetical protein